MSEQKNPSREIKKRKITSAFLWTGVFLLVFECITAYLKYRPAFFTGEEQVLFYLSLAGMSAIFAIFMWFTWTVFLYPVKMIFRKVLGTDSQIIKQLPHSLILIFTWIFVFISYTATKTFLTRFHNHDMIAFSLAAIQALCLFVFLLLIALVVNRRSDQKLTPQKPGFVSKFAGFIFNNYTFTTVCVGIIVYFNFEWLSAVIDFWLISELVGFVLFVYFLACFSEGKPGRFLGNRFLNTLIILMAVLLVAGSLMTINYSQNLKVAVHRNSVIPAKTLFFLSKAVPIKTIPSLRTAPLESGDFDLQTYFRQNIQEYPFDTRPIPEILGDTSDWNVIVLSVDAIRADHVGCYGYPVPTTPNIDKIAENGVVFDRNFIQGGDSPNSINSFMSGIFPKNFKSKHSKMMKDILKLHGYVTCFVGYEALFKAHPFRKNYDDMVMLDTPYNQIWKSTTSEAMIDEIIGLVEKNRDNKFFLYSHMLDPHAGYLRTPQTKLMEGSEHKAYDGEIAHSDFHIGRLLDYLEKENLLDRTLLMITSDHGEEFLDHGDRWHGKYLYTESIRTPMVMSLPKLKNRRVQLPTGSVDMVPTMLAFLGIEADPPRDGINLLPLIYHGDASSLVPIYSMIPNSTYRKYGMIYGPWKFIYTRKSQIFELFNMDVDWDEKLNQVDRYLNLAVNLRNMLTTHFGSRVPIPEIVSGNAIPESSLKKMDPENSVLNHGIGNKPPKGTMSQSAKAKKQGMTLQEPRDISFGPKGQYAIADFRNGRVAIFDFSGQFHSAFGKRGNGTGQFTDLCGVDWGEDGSIYVADTFNHRIHKFNPSGEIIWTSAYRLDYPRDIKLAADGIWVANSGSSEVIKLDLTGKFIKTVGGKDEKENALSKPTGIDVDTDGNLYVADTGNKRVQIYNAAGEFTRTIPVKGWEPSVFTLPYLCIDNNQNMFVTDPPTHSIIVYDLKTGNEIRRFPPDNAMKSPFHFPMGIDFEPEHDAIGVVDCRHNRILNFKRKSILADLTDSKQNKDVSAESTEY